jgi:flagellar protein FliO/FliZ
MIGDIPHFAPQGQRIEARQPRNAECPHFAARWLAGTAVVALAPGGAQAASGVPGLEVTGLSTMIMSLALVIGFIFAAAFVAKRMPFGLGARGNAGTLKVLAALPLGPKERLLLVQARGEEILIAVSPAGVFNVGAQAVPGTTPSAPRPAEPAPAPAPAFVLRDEP